MTLWPAASRRGMILCQHHAPCHEPWMSTYVLIAVVLLRRLERAPRERECVALHDHTSCSTSRCYVLMCGFRRARWRSCTPSHASAGCRPRWGAPTAPALLVFPPLPMRSRASPVEIDIAKAPRKPPPAGGRYVLPGNGLESGRGSGDDRGGRTWGSPAPILHRPRRPVPESSSSPTQPQKQIFARHVDLPP